METTTVYGLVVAPYGNNKVSILNLIWRLYKLANVHVWQL